MLCFSFSWFSTFLSFLSMKFLLFSCVSTFKAPGFSFCHFVIKCPGFYTKEECCDTNPATSVFFVPWLSLHNLASCSQSFIILLLFYIILWLHFSFIVFLAILFPFHSQLDPGSLFTRFSRTEKKYTKKINEPQWLLDWDIL